MTVRIDGTAFKNENFKKESSGNAEYQHQQLKSWTINTKLKKYIIMDRFQNQETHVNRQRDTENQSVHRVADVMSSASKPVLSGTRRIVFALFDTNDPDR